MKSSLNRLFRKIAKLAPIARLSMQGFERYKAAQAGDIPRYDDAGVPVPSALHMVTVVGHANWDQFAQTGARDLAAFRDGVDRNGGAFGEAKRILDFGCGCGRLARHISGLSKAEVLGADYNPMLIDWCRDNLNGRFIQNQLKPPLELASSHIDVLYALSVFTHLREATQRAWMAEFARLVVPGGFCLVTFHDETHAHLDHVQSSPAALERAGILYHNDRAEGSNLLSTFQSRAHITALATPYFDLCEIVPSDQSPIGQAICILRAR